LRRIARQENCGEKAKKVERERERVGAKVRNAKYLCNVFILFFMICRLTQVEGAQNDKEKN